MNSLDEYLPVSEAYRHARNIQISYYTLAKQEKRRHNSKGYDHCYTLSQEAGKAKYLIGQLDREDVYTMSVDHLSAVCIATLQSARRKLRREAVVCDATAAQYYHKGIVERSNVYAHKASTYRVVANKITALIARGTSTDKENEA